MTIYNLYQIKQLGASALIRACHYDRLHIIRYLIEHVEIDPNPASKNEWSAVGEASMRGKLVTLKYLCENVCTNIILLDHVSFIFDESH
jgi:ankyrin repeat protein